MYYEYGVSEKIIKPVSEYLKCLKDMSSRPKYDTYLSSCTSDFKNSIGIFLYVFISHLTK